MISFGKCVLFMFLSCCNSGQTIEALTVSEAQQIALESSGELLPPENLVRRVEKDLQAIRTHFPEITDITSTGQWSPGKLIVSNVKKQTLDAINRSKYGPVDARAIFQDQIYLLTFTKPYNPIKLAQVLKQELGVSNAEPDGIVGGSSGIKMTPGPSGKNTYVFFRGSGDCPAGCINKRYITFTVDSQQKSIVRVSDTGNDPSTKRY